MYVYGLKIRVCSNPEASDQPAHDKILQPIIKTTGDSDKQFYSSTLSPAISASTSSVCTPPELHLCVFEGSFGSGAGLPRPIANDILLEDPDVCAFEHEEFCPIAGGLIICAIGVVVILFG